MELDFSFFGFRPTPKTKQIGTASTNEDYSKLSLKKKSNLKVGTSSRHDSARTLKELMPTVKTVCETSVKNKSRRTIRDSCQNNSSTEANQEKENTNPCRSAENHSTSICGTSRNNDSQYTMRNRKSLRQIHCVISTSVSDSSSSNEATANSLSSDGSPSPLLSKHSLGEQNYINHDITTIIISDSSTCSNSEAGSISTPLPNMSRHRTKDLHLLKDSRLHNIEGDNNLQSSVSSIESISEALLNTNKSCEYISLTPKFNSNLLLPSDECHGTTDTCSSCSKAICWTTGPTKCNTDIKENAAICDTPNIILETSDSGSEQDCEPQNVLGNLSMFPRPSENLLLKDVAQEGGQSDGSFTKLQTPHMTTSKYKDIQKWLSDRSTPSEPDTDVSLICNSQECCLSSECSTNIPKAEETNSKDILSLSTENILSHVYGPTWNESNITVSKKSQTEGRKPSYILSSSEIDDSFDEFLKKFNRKHKKLTSKNLPDVVGSPDFINDDSISNESLGFYQAVHNSVQRTVVTSRISQEAGSSKELHSAKHLQISNTNRKLSFSDEDLEDEPVINSNTNKVYQQTEEDNVTFIKRKVLGEFQPSQPNVPVQKKNEHTKTAKALQLKIHTNIHSFQMHSFLESLSATTPEPCCHPEAHYFKSNFKKRKEELCVKLFTMFNSRIFGSALPEDLKIEWNVRLRRTAGLCFNRHVRSASGERVRTSRIELSTKVCDSPGRLRDTLIHELCHAATWIINAVQNGHGHFWKVWSVKARQGYPELPPIERCHDYKIQTKFTYKCSVCGYCLDRHSKSLNMDTKRCGYCHGKFELFVNYKNKARVQLVENSKTPRNPNGFALFVKQNYGSLKSTRKDLKHGDVMKLLGQQFSAAKIS